MSGAGANGQGARLVRSLHGSGPQVGGPLQPRIPVRAVARRGGTSHPEHRPVEAREEERPSTHTHRLEVDNGHLIARFDGARGLLDTGSPCSFGECGAVTVAGVEVVLGRGFPPLDAASVRELAGADFDCLIGTDVLGRRPFTIDLRAGELCIGELPDGPRHALRTIGGVPVVDAEVLGRRLACFLDTGATICFLPSELQWPGPATGRHEDFYPGLGRFDTATRTARIRMFGHAFEVTVGELPGMLAGLMQGFAPGIVGLEVFAKGRVGLDLGAGEAVFIPYQT